MRKLLIYMVMLMVLVGCETVQENERFKPVDPSAIGGRRHVLVEYTGFRCMNCPEAAKLAQEMKDICGEHLIIVSAHPAANPYTKGKYDYTSSAADSLYLWMGGKAETPFPTGNIDLQPYNGQFFTESAQWMAALMLSMRDRQSPTLLAQAQWDESSSEIAVQVQHSIQDARCAVWLIEDSIQGAQAMPGGEVQTDYIHRHVLRAAANDAVWGEPITSDTTQIRISIEPQWNQAHLSIVALLIDKDDKHILQAYETKCTDFTH